MANLNELTIKEAIEGLKAGKFTSVELTKACLKRISETDEKLKVFITLTKERALEDAEKADSLIEKEGANAFEKHPLLGVPYVAKDNFCTKGIETTASSAVLKEYIPPYESTVTQRLEDSGAVLLGKVNMDAFAHGSSTETSDFFTTKNPWNTSKVPGGSSGGSAAAVAADMCVFAIGSETGGSIRGPASWCGTVGLKPSYGRVSRYGVVAMASSTDCPGPLTKTVEDSALVLAVIAGKDEYDATSSFGAVPNYTDVMADFDITGIKVGVPKSYFEMDLSPEVKEIVEDKVRLLEEMGAEIIELDLLDPKYSVAVYTILQRSEVSSNLARLDGNRFGQARDNFGFEAKKRMMLGAYTLSAGYYDAYYAKAQKVRTLIVNDYKEAFSRVDVLVAPSMPCVALEIGESQGEKAAMFGELMDVLNEPSCIAGVPGITLNAGFSEGLPVGIQFMAPMLEESKIFGIANALEKRLNLTERPKI